MCCVALLCLCYGAFNYFIACFMAILLFHGAFFLGGGGGGGGVCVCVCGNDTFNYLFMLYNDFMYFHYVFFCEGGALYI